MKDNFICCLVRRLIAAQTCGETLHSWASKHIRLCDACRAESESYAKMLRMLRETDEDVKCRLVWSAPDVVSGPGAAGGRSLRWLYLSAACAAVICGLMLVSHRAPQSDTVRTVAPKTISRIASVPRPKTETPAPPVNESIGQKQVKRHRRAGRVRVHSHFHSSRKHSIVQDTSVIARVSDDQVTPKSSGAGNNICDSLERRKLSDQAGTFIADGVIKMAKNARNFRYAKVEQTVKDVLSPILEVNSKGI